MKVLLLGAGGLLGRTLATALADSSQRAPMRVVARTHGELDITDTAALDRALAMHPVDWVVNASAYANVDGAERDEDVAMSVNATAVGELAQLCRRHGSALLHYSTDFVFDGTKDGFYVETDECRPLSAYGRSKLAGEDLVRRSGARHLIIRTQWLYGPGGRSFVSTLTSRARAAVETRVVDDEFGGCTYVADLAATSLRALQAGLEGTYHVANRGRVSRYIIAERVFAAFGVSGYLAPVRASEFPVAARRPRNSPLDVSKVERALGVEMPRWENALDRYLATEARARAGVASERQGAV